LTRTHEGHEGNEGHEEKKTKENKRNEFLHALHETSCPSRVPFGLGKLFCLLT
jgi:hypothetical protein